VLRNGKPTEFVILVRDHIVRSTLGAEAELDGVPFKASIVKPPRESAYRGGRGEDVFHVGDVLRHGQHPGCGFVSDGAWIDPDCSVRGRRLGRGRPGPQGEDADGVDDMHIDVGGGCFPGERLLF
jgi:hypothetical protein